jgi:cytochrome P450 family 144
MARAQTDPLFDLEVVEQPHQYYAQLRAFDPVHRIQGTDAFLVARLDLIREVIATPQIYSSQSSEFLHLGESGEPCLRSPADVPPDLEGVEAVLATADPPDHGRQRKILSHLFSVSAISTREAEFRRLIDSTLDPYLRVGQVDWMSDVAEPLPVVMLTRLLGLPDDTAPALKEQGYASVELISGFVLEAARTDLQAKMAELGPIIDAYVAARSSGLPDQSTVIGACAQAVADGRLSEVEAFVILGILLAAGGESTTSLLGTGVRILAERPDLQHLLRSRPELIPAFVEEACRIDPPFRGHYRRVRADTTLGGVQLEAGSRLILLWPSANHDSEAYEDPEDIDVYRASPRNHVGFGWGIHLCLGAPLARMEAKVTFERLLARTSSFNIDVAPEDLRHHKSLMVRRLVELPLSLQR